MAISSPNIVQGKENPLVSALKYANDSIRQSLQLMQNAKQLQLVEKDIETQKNINMLGSLDAQFNALANEYGVKEAWSRMKYKYAGLYGALGLSDEAFMNFDNAMNTGASSVKDLQIAALKALTQGSDLTMMSAADIKTAPPQQQEAVAEATAKAATPEATPTAGTAQTKEITTEKRMKTELVELKGEEQPEFIDAPGQEKVLPILRKRIRNPEYKPVYAARMTEEVAIPSMTLTVTGPPRVLKTAEERDQWRTDFEKSIVGQKDNNGVLIDANAARIISLAASEIPPLIGKPAGVGEVKTNKPLVADARASTPPPAFRSSEIKKAMTPGYMDVDAVDDRSAYKASLSIYERWCKSMVGIEWGKGDAMRYSAAIKDYFKNVPQTPVSTAEIGNYLAFLGGGDVNVGMSRLNMALHESLMQTELAFAQEARLAEKVFTPNQALLDQVGIKLENPHLNADQMQVLSGFLASAFASMSQGDTAKYIWEEFKLHAEYLQKANSEMWNAAKGDMTSYNEKVLTRIDTDTAYSTAYTYFNEFERQKAPDASTAIQSQGKTPAGFLGLGAVFNPQVFGVPLAPTLQMGAERLNRAAAPVQVNKAANAETQGFYEKKGFTPSYQRVTK